MGVVALLVLVSACAPVVPSGATGLSRWLLGGAALAGIGLWLRRGGAGARVADAPPLRVLGRAGLGPRCGIALVQAEGRSFLVTHGDGFADVHLLAGRRGRTRRKAQARRRPAASKVVLQ